MLNSVVEEHTYSAFEALSFEENSPKNHSLIKP